MKRIISLALVAVMLMASLVITTNAATPFGTVVEIPYSETAPSMKEALPDASWGDPITHIDGKSPNAGITQYKKSGVVKQDLSFDLYARWTKDTLYFCFVSPDPDFTGGTPNFWWGDGVQMIIFPGIIDISYCNGVSTGWTAKEQYERYDWCATFDWDSVGLSCSDVADGNCCIYGDEKTSNLVVKFAIPTTAVDYKKGEEFKEGALFSFALNRIDGSDEDPNNEAYVGWLEWGDFFNAQKGWNPNDHALYVPTAENKKTTSANTFKLVGGSTGTALQQEQPVDVPVAPIEHTVPAEDPKEQPAEYAKAEVAAAIEAELVPENLQKDYEKATTRGAVAQMFVNLLEKASGKSVDEIMKEKGVEINEKAFTDTTDKAVLAANALSIINGVGDGKFDPNGTLKRAQIAAIINRVARVMGVKTEGFTHTFTDITDNYKWVDAELGWPVSAKIINGVGNNKFDPDGDLKTQDAILITYRALNALKK